MKIKYSFPTKVRVRYGETDQMGYCYYGNYASYFEVGRVEAMRALGMSYRFLEQNGVMLPVSRFEVDYHKPALYDDELTVVTAITELKGPRLFFEYTLLNVDNVCIASGKTTLVFVLKETMRPISPPKMFVDLIEKYNV